MAAEEVVARLVQAGLFDKAVDASLQFGFPLESIFEALASRYALASFYSVMQSNSPIPAGVSICQQV